MTEQFSDVWSQGESLSTKKKEGKKRKEKRSGEREKKLKVIRNVSTEKKKKISLAGRSALLKKRGRDNRKKKGSNKSRVKTGFLVEKPRGCIDGWGGNGGKNDIGFQKPERIGSQKKKRGEKREPVIRKEGERTVGEGKMCLKQIFDAWQKRSHGKKGAYQRSKEGVFSTKKRKKGAHRC